MTELSIHDWPLPYEPRLATRLSTDIDMVVIHCTELPDLATAREYGERIRYPETQTGNSGHYYIDRDGSIHQFVSALRVAHHVFRYNPRSIGIELVNLGRYPDWNDSRHQLMTEAYPAAQIDELVDSDEDTAAYVSDLEAAADDQPTTDDIDGDDIDDEDSDPGDLVEEVERFLRGN